MEFKRVSKQKVQRNGAIATNGSGFTSYVSINNNSQGQGHGSLSVDSLLSQTSVNPVENRTITAALQGKVDRNLIINRDNTLRIEVTDTSIYIDSSTFSFDSSGNLAFNGTIKVNEIGADSLRTGAELILYGASATITIDSDGIYYEPTTGTAKGKTWAQLLS